MKLKSIFFLASMSLASIAYAQQTYFLQTVQEPYQELQGATVLTSDSIWDDSEFALPLPFSFTIGSNTLDSIHVMESGLSSHAIYLDLDAPEVGLTGLSAIVAYSTDLVDRAEHDGGNPQSPISYKTLTENGQDIFVVEYKNAGFYDEDVFTGTSSDYVNFQIRLIEDNSIEIHYGESNVSTPEVYFEGNSGTSVAIFPNYGVNLQGEIEINEPLHFLVDAPVNPNVELVSNVLQMMNGMPALDGIPANGTKYIFSLTDPTIGQVEIDNSGITMLNPVGTSLVFAAGEQNVNRIEIINPQGQQVLNTTGINSVDVSTLTSGVYMVKFYNENGVLSTQKMIKS